MKSFILWKNYNNLDKHCLELPHNHPTYFNRNLCCKEQGLNCQGCKQAEERNELKKGMFMLLGLYGRHPPFYLAELNGKMPTQKAAFCHSSALSISLLYISIIQKFVQWNVSPKTLILIVIAFKASTSACHFCTLGFCYHLSSLSFGISKGCYFQPNPKQVRMGSHHAPCQGCYHQHYNNHPQHGTIMINQ